MSSRHYRSIVVLTGAGVSAESGLRTFRGSDGLWEGERVEDVATPEAFQRDPARVHRFYNARRAQLAAVEPNAAHLALANFERNFDGEFLLITQNVDNLHERAGSENLCHMHGELSRVRCDSCGEVLDWVDDLSVEMGCSTCSHTGLLRPHIVWFGEIPFEMERIERALDQCDLFVAIGTSGNVYPAAGFVQVATLAKAHTVELNLEPSSGYTLFREQHYGRASEIVPMFLQNIICD